MAEPAVQPAAWRRALPFVLALGLVGFVVARLDFHRFAVSLEHTSLVALLGLTLVFTLALLLVDCIASLYVYRLLVGPIRLGDLLVLRGASYAPGLLNHHAGQAWLTYAIARSCDAPILRVTGSTLVVYATTFACLGGIAAASLLFGAAGFSWLPPVLAVFGAGAAVYAVVLAVRPRWFVQARLTAPLAQAGLRGHLIATALRAPHVVVLFFGTWLPFLLFGVHIPFADALALMPPLMVLVALPITPQGLGTRDLFAAQVLAGFAAGDAATRAATVAAASLCWAIALTLVQVPLSLLLLRPAARRIVVPRSRP